MTIKLGSRLVMGFALVLFAAFLAFAEDQIVVKKDGSKIIGEITKDGDNYKVKTKTGEVIVPVKDVERIDQTDKSKYDKKAAEIKADDPNVTQKRYELAKWAFDLGLFNECLEQCNILDQNKWGNDPFYQRIGPKLKEQAESNATGKPADKPADKGAQTQTATPKTTGTEDSVEHDFQKELLTNEQISRIRLEELDKEKDISKNIDKAVAVVFKQGAIDKFMKKLEGRNDYDKAAFLKMKELEKLLYLLDAFGGKELEEVKDSVIINSDPKFMIDFKNKVWPLVRTNCASSNCHGGGKGKGGFYLYGGGPPDRQLYTNFIIMRGFTKGSNQMLNVQEPDKSLLLCYSLPRDKTEIKHPYANQKEVDAGGPGVGPIEKPVICSSKDIDSYKRMSEWISSLQLLMRIDYNLGSWKPWGMDEHYFQLRPSVSSILGVTQSQPAPKQE